MEAHKKNLVSIAIPALGTGIHGVPPEVSAEVMFDELCEFCRLHPRTSLRDVRFVVNLCDIQTVQVGIHHYPFTGYLSVKRLNLLTYMLSIMYSLDGAKSTTSNVIVILKQYPILRTSRGFTLYFLADLFNQTLSRISTFWRGIQPCCN